MSKPRTYIVTTRGDQLEDVNGVARVEFPGGAAVFYDHLGNMLLAYGNGAWKEVEGEVVEDD